MSIGEVCWTIFLAGLPLCPFLDKRMDIWHMETSWSHAWVAILFALTFFALPKNKVSNKSFAVWVGWVCLWTWWMWHQKIAGLHEYAFQVLIPFMNFIIVVGFYQAFIHLVDRKNLKTLFLWMARAYAIVVFYGYLQLAELDQFFRQLDVNATGNPLVGTIGNPTHFGTYLILGLPLVLMQDGLFWKIIVVLVGILLYFCQSMGALIAGTAGFLWWVWHRERRYFWYLVALVMIFGIYFCMQPKALNPFGRWEAWQYFWNIFMMGPKITGQGIGYVMAYSKTIAHGPMQHWRHCHNEFLQALIEQGIIGLFLIMWTLLQLGKRVWNMPKTKEVVGLTAIMIGFVLNSMTSFPVHTWLLGSFGILAYSALMLLSSEEIPYGVKNP